MDKFILFILASAGAAFAALVSADASALGGSDAQQTAQASMSWRAVSQARGCRIQMRWQKDYAGQTYLRKVRICA